MTLYIKDSFKQESNKSSLLKELFTNIPKLRKWMKEDRPREVRIISDSNNGNIYTTTIDTDRLNNNGTKMEPHKQHGGRKNGQHSQEQIGKRSKNDQESDGTMFWRLKIAA